MVKRLVAGCMTGTSIDNIDAALVRITGRGLEMRAEFICGASLPLGDLAPRLRRLAEQEPMAAGEIARLSREFSLAHVPALREAAAGDRLDLVCVHGQTVFHQPPVSWQMLTPACIARELGAAVVCDLRAADLAAGGQGAPITPLADWVLLRDPRVGRTVVNLGGFCNTTRLPARPASADDLGWIGLVEGGDVCPCNHLLDSIARTCLGRPFDDGGRAAKSGRVSAAAAESLRRALPTGRGRSLGTGDELLGWVAEWKSREPGPDLAATGCAVIAERICSAAAGDLVLAGGSVRNEGLVSAIRAAATGRVMLCDDLGLPAAYREAACFAVLGALCEDRISITLPRVTGVGTPAPISGVWVYT